MTTTVGRTAILASLALLGLSAAALAHDYTLHSLFIDRPYARATPPGATAGGAYLSIENGGSAPDTLLAARSPAAGMVEIHEMSMDGNVMRMRALPGGITIPAGGKVALAPGGYHIMLMDLKQPLAAGKSIPLTLVFAKAGSIDVDVHVEAMGAMGGATSPDIPGKVH
jgi:periplasmic copper chaperone A